MKVSIRGSEFTFGADQLKARVDPTVQVVLFSENVFPDSFSFEIGLDCNEKPFFEAPGGPCFGSYGVSHGSVRDIHKFRKTDGRDVPVN